MTAAIPSGSDRTTTQDDPARGDGRRPGDGGRDPLGELLNAAIAFVVVAFAVWRISTLFIGEEAAGPTADEVLLSEIRDQLRASNRCGQAPAARG